MDQNSELFESVRETVGRTVKLTLRRKVQLEVKGDKVESRVLALASHRAYLLTARLPSKNAAVRTASGKENRGREGGPAGSRKEASFQREPSPGLC
ncbi:F-actin-uncapping protein LRRC16A [Takifugu rubripes]|uniref:F-actin-uncapping protein LRRC16A n=1 Tax=Takifugu rubripes TaxID=31033 RepID=UPI001145D7A3|nr:F-actin-uncapping protein LRRC16A-like [Takifugu rubripes]